MGHNKQGQHLRENEYELPHSGKKMAPENTSRCEVGRKGDKSEKAYGGQEKGGRFRWRGPGSSGWGSPRSSVSESAIKKIIITIRCKRGLPVVYH
jgi:hypothetical protein